MLDGITIIKEPKEAAPLGTPLSVNKSKDTCTLDVHVRLVKDLEGRHLIPDENCPFDSEKLDELDIDKKSSMFWVTYTDHNGITKQTPKIAWI